MLDLNVDAVSADSAWDETDPLPRPKSATAARGGFLADDYSGASSSVVNNATTPIGDEESNSSSGTRMTTLEFSILNGSSANHIIPIVDGDDDDDGNDQELITRQLFPSPKTESFPLTATRPQQWLKLSVPEVGGGIEMGFCNKVGLQHHPQQQVAAGQANQQQVKKSRRGPRSRSSQYRGVTFYRRTGRWESHIWDCGKQVYLGGFDTAHAAAMAYDRAAIKFRGVDADINFHINDYEEDMKQMKNLTKEDFVHILRRQSTGFSRGSSKYRGITLHKCGRWEARMGQFLGKKAYDKAAIQCNGREAFTNFVPSAYDEEIRATKDGVSDNLDLKLWISPAANKLKEEDGPKSSYLQYYAASELQAEKRIKVESSVTTPDGLPMPSQESSVWASRYSGFGPNNQETARKMRAEGIPLSGLSNWPWKMHFHSVITSMPLFSSAASSGFSTTTTYSTSLLSSNTQNKIAHTAFPSPPMTTLNFK